LGKNHPNFRKSSQNTCQFQKYQNIFIKAQFESPKHPHQPLKIATTNNIFCRKSSGPLKSSQMTKFYPIWSPCRISKEHRGKLFILLLLFKKNSANTPILDSWISFSPSTKELLAESFFHRLSSPCCRLSCCSVSYVCKNVYEIVTRLMTDAAPKLVTVRLWQLEWIISPSVK
jgi:hypothetical protein